MGNNFAAVHKSLEGTVGNWNRLVNQAESRVVSRARRFRDLGAATGLDEIVELPQVAALPTLPSSAELKALPEAGED
ncbi:MAG: hypothetical protein ACMVO5_10980 [Polymorphobacter sp.]|uniref:hypothetical protein n=1 Tax=Polymorphobacter sp. TaxID=1909290 RepID=UPI003A8729CE